MGEFFAMGNYGAYVWFAYGITLISLVMLFIWSWFGARARESELEQARKWARAERRGPSSTSSSAALPEAAGAGNKTAVEGGMEPMPTADASRGGA